MTSCYFEKMVDLRLDGLNRLLLPDMIIHPIFLVDSQQVQSRVGYHIAKPSKWRGKAPFACLDMCR